MTDIKKKYDKQYQKKRKHKLVSFNLETEYDLYLKANSLKDFSIEVKNWLKNRDYNG